MGAPGSFMKLNDQRFGRLTVKDFVIIKGIRKWECVCDCGNVSFVQPGKLISGGTQSCGCLQKELSSERHTTHGMWKNKHPAYGVWNGLKNRCNNKNDSSYKNYGGRGITYSPEWEDFEKFAKWADSSGYQKGLSIERIDYNGNYEPSNCTWIPLSEQPHNKRGNVFFEYKGEIFALKDLVPDPKRRKRVRERLWYGWTVERAVETP